MVSVSVRYLFYKPVDEKIKTWTFRFPVKENPYMEKALFGRPIVWQYDVKDHFLICFIMNHNEKVNFIFSYEAFKTTQELHRPF